MISCDDCHDMKSPCHGPQNPHGYAPNLISYPGVYSQSIRLKAPWTNVRDFRDQTFPSSAPLHLLFLPPVAFLCLFHTLLFLSIWCRLQFYSQRPLWVPCAPCYFFRLLFFLLILTTLCNSIIRSIYFCFCLMILLLYSLPRGPNHVCVVH